MLIMCWSSYFSQYSDSLRVGQSGDRIPVETRFFAPVQTGSGGLPSLLYGGYRVSLPRVKRPGRDVNHPPPSSAEGKERVFAVGGGIWHPHRRDSIFELHRQHHVTRMNQNKVSYIEAQVMFALGVF
jgi:hypothetical protein